MGDYCAAATRESNHLNIRGRLISFSRETKATKQSLFRLRHQISEFSFRETSLN